MQDKILPLVNKNHSFLKIVVPLHVVDYVGADYNTLTVFLTEANMCGEEL